MNSATNKETRTMVTDRQIQDLLREAGTAGDELQVALCLVALGYDLVRYQPDARVESQRIELLLIGVVPEDAVGQDRARAACDRVLSDVEAQS
jgi:hypothetical protein